VSMRPAAYAVCMADERVLLARHVWTAIPDVARLRRSSLVDIGIALALTGPAIAGP
jgi:hypothetical protein